MNASSEGSTIADSKRGLKNGRSISKLSEKKIVTKIFPSPFQKNCFLSTKSSKPLLNGVIVFLSPGQMLC